MALSNEVSRSLGAYLDLLRSAKITGKGIAMCRIFPLLDLAWLKLRKDITTWTHRSTLQDRIHG